MKRYIRASNGYNDIFRKITQYFMNFAKSKGQPILHTMIMW